MGEPRTGAYSRHAAEGIDPAAGPGICRRTLERQLTDVVRRGTSHCIVRGWRARYVHISESNQHVARCSLSADTLQSAESVGPRPGLRRSVSFRHAEPAWAQRIRRFEEYQRRGCIEPRADLTRKCGRTL